MLKIKRRLFKILILITVVGILAGLNGGMKLTLGNSTARAIGDLTVNWGVPDGQPFFSVSNMAPGDSVTKSIEIYNGASSGRPVGIRGTKTSSGSFFADYLKIIISRNGLDLYGGTNIGGQKTLSQFFNDSMEPEGIELFTVSPGSSATIQVKVIFDKSAGNEFQEKNVVFDIAIGIAVKIPEECKGIAFSGNPIFGTEKGDTIKGTGSNDLIFSFEGNDTIDAGAGNDCVVAGVGNDAVKGGDGDDVIFGGAGNDSISGNNGNDKIFGEAGTDTIDGGIGDDMIYGGTEKDIISGGDGNDYIEGNEGDDICSGGNGDDIINGGDGNDTVDGGKGINKCSAEIMSKCIKI
jgi:Ca2+-binding RTX toxin-like protein